MDGFPAGMPSASAFTTHPKTGDEDVPPPYSRGAIFVVIIIVIPIDRRRLRQRLGLGSRSDPHPIWNLALLTWHFPRSGSAGAPWRKPPACLPVARDSVPQANWSPGRPHLGGPRPVLPTGEAFGKAEPSGARWTGAQRQPRRGTAGGPDQISWMFGASHPDPFGA
jgi:hypothetical protein